MARSMRLGDYGPEGLVLRRVDENPPPFSGDLAFIFPNNGEGPLFKPKVWQNPSFIQNASKSLTAVAELLGCEILPN